MNATKLQAEIRRDIKAKGKRSYFVETTPGVFGLSAYGQKQADKKWGKKTPLRLFNPN